MAFSSFPSTPKVLHLMVQLCMDASSSGDLELDQAAGCSRFWEETKFKSRMWHLKGTETNNSSHPGVRPKGGCQGGSPRSSRDGHAGTSDTPRSQQTISPGEVLQQVAKSQAQAPVFRRLIFCEVCRYKDTRPDN